MVAKLQNYLPDTLIWKSDGQTVSYSRLQRVVAPFFWNHAVGGKFPQYPASTSALLQESQVFVSVKV